ncbi:MAG: Peptidoglycan-binding domain 1 protein [Acidimicrobiaceae bacterium]|nr:Peptidoglycan-binding domain 1 protein [Acidimicrobiaceae bacterium]
MSSPYPTPSPSGRRHLPTWLATRRRRLALGAGVIVVVAVVVIAVADPFGSSTPSSAGVTDNSYPTSTRTVTEQNLSSQTSVSATLGYAGSYTVSLPSGTTASTVIQAQATVQADETKVSQDETALSSAKSTAKPSNASTLLAAQATVNTDKTTLSEAEAQLASDEHLSCPPSSSDTVTTAVGGSSTPSSSSPSSSSPSSSSPSSSSPSSSTPAGGSGGGARAHLSAAISSGSGNTGSGPTTTTTIPATPPTASTGPADQTTNTATELTGTVNPDGADTTYSFEYGTSPNYGATTTSTDAGSGTSDVGITTSLTGLTPGATYHYRLVAKSSLGTAYGQDATVTTNAAPVATTGAATTLSATSESLAGTVNPNGADTSYFFEWGTSAAFGHKSAVIDAGAAASAASVTATITGLKPGATYDFALVATNALGTSTGTTTTFQAAESSCVAERRVITEDSQALTEAKNALSVDKLGENSSVTSAEQTLSSDQASLAAAQQALSADQTQATNANTTFTALPAVGKVISRGMSVYSLDSKPVPLLYGTTTMYRALSLGVSDGPDVAELQANLIALGFGSGITASAHFSSATEADLKAWQRSLGLSPTGVLALGDVLVEPGAIQVDTVSVSDGAAATGGSAVLTASSTSREVSISLDASQQSEVKVGDPVTVTLPNNSTTPGVVSSVGSVATAPASSGGSTGGSSNPTITVEVTLTDPKATGNLDQAPVTVAITNASVNNALVVPVSALLALANGGYALEEVESSGYHQLVPVTLGLFDDADGLVQVIGSGVAAGQKIVVPNT